MVSPDWWGRYTENYIAASYNQLHAYSGIQPLGTRLLSAPSLGSVKIIAMVLITMELQARKVLRTGVPRLGILKLIRG